jgi:hypothetical protein
MPAIKESAMQRHHAGPRDDPRSAAIRRRSWGRLFLLLAIAALSLTALVAIGILLFGSFNETAGRILLTVAAIGGYSLLALAATTALDREPAWLGPVGLATVAAGFLTLVWLIWIDDGGDVLGRLTAALLTLGVAIAHAALLLLVTHRTEEGAVANVRRATLGASSLVTVMILIPLLTAWDGSGGYFRVLGAVSVLAVLGTLLTPIVQKLTAPPSAAPHAADVPGSAMAAVTPLELTYKGRRFIVELDDRAHPARLAALTAWEIGDDQLLEPVIGIEGQTVDARDPHAALASAVRLITRAIDVLPPDGQSPSGKRAPA